MSTSTEHEGPDQAVVTAPWSRAKILLAIVVAGVLAGLAITWYLVANRDDKAPYTDPAATGTLTFCDADGNEVTGGSVEDRPFADVVVGSTAAQAPYSTAGLATLFAYQPREGVTAEEFSGVQLTAASPLSDTEHPAARVTSESTPLSDFVAAFPAAWDGYVQLRLILTAPGSPARTDRYDAADVRIDGDRWQLVTGGGGDCSGAGSTTSPDKNVTP